MRTRWIFFWTCGLVALIAFGGWRSALQQTAQATRGVERATRQDNLPYRLPLAGVNVELTQYENPEAELQQMADLGFTWVRQPFLWSEIEPTQGVYEWGKYDLLVEAVSAFDGQLKIVALLDGTPAWARHRDAPEHPFAPPESPAAYGEFARAVAERYGETIDFYQIWDEPNIEEHWGNLNPRPALYVAMLEAAYKNIHAADTHAMVIAAALAPNVEDGPDNINDPAYLKAMYELGGGVYFDAAAGKPYGFDFSPDDRRVDVNTLNFSRLILLREEMVRQGDTEKPLWGSNFGWNALPDDWTGAPSIWGSVSQETQIEYTRRALERAQNEWAWVGGLILQHWQPDAPTDDPIQGFALAPDAEKWRGIIPEQNLMRAGLYPAVNPYAVYEGDWQFGELGADAGANADQNTITIVFEGTEFAMQVRRGDYLSYLLVTIDGEPANALPRNNDGEAFIALTSEKREPVIDLILAAENLGAGNHIAVITHRPELGDDQWPIVGFAVGTQPDTHEFPQNLALGVMLLALILMVGTGTRLNWGAIRLPSAKSLRNIADMLLGLVFSSVVMGGMLLTFHETLTTGLKRELPTLLATLATSSILYFAPSTWISLIGLLILGVVIFSRPWVGILQVIFWAAFYTSTSDALFRTLATVELILAVTTAATFARLVYETSKSVKAEGLNRLFQAVKSIQLHPLDLCMLALMGLGVISLTWSDLLPEALRELRVMILEPAIFYFLIRLLKPDVRDVAFLAETLIFTGFVLSVVGLFQFFVTETSVVVAEGGTRRLASVYGSPNGLGLMLGRCLPFALAYLLTPVSQWRKILAGVSGVTMLIALGLSQSVGAILLGVPVSIVVVILGWRGKKAVPLLGGLAAAGVMALIPLSLVIPRLRQITDIENNTTVFRLNLWRSSFQMLQDHPITGIGLDQFLYQYRSRYILPQAWADPDLSHPHNLVLDYWVRLGLFGLILGVAMQFFFWKQALRVYHQGRHGDTLRFALILGAMGAMADVLAHGLVDMAFFNINLSYVFVLLLVMVIQLDSSHQGHQET